MQSSHIYTELVALENKAQEEARKDNQWHYWRAYLNDAYFKLRTDYIMLRLAEGLERNSEVSYDTTPVVDATREEFQRTDDAYWLRKYAGIALQNLLSLTYDPRDNIGYRVCQSLAPECFGIARDLLAEIKKHEVENATRP